MTVTAAALALYGAWKLVDNAFNITFEAVQKDLDAATEGFNEAKSELDSVNTELETTVDKIQEFEGKDSLTLVEEIELEKLREARDLLEAQQKIRQQAYAAAQKEVVDAAKESFNFESETVHYTSEDGTTYTAGNGLVNSKMSRGEAIETYVARMQRAQQAINEAQKAINDGDTV